jgi:putative methyltransferase (TIGR04325 family)
VIWSGVHRSFDELEDEGGGFVHPRWLEKSVERLDRAREATTAAPSAEYPILDAILGAWDGTGVVDILDVGGNLGQLALDVRRRAPAVPTTWTVLERQDLLDAARLLTRLPEEVEFQSDRVHLAGRRFDVLHLGSVLQYFEDWRGELAALCDDHARSDAWLVISDAMAGDGISSFVTRQAYYELGLRMHFLNLNELIEHLAVLGFRPILMEPYLTPLTSSYYPEQDLPEGLRIAHPLNLVLRRGG